MDEGLMTEPHLNGDFSRRVTLRTAAMDWQASPSPSVWRKRLERIGGDSEKAQVTSVVRYDADSAFSGHDHPDGEEILVLDGIFSDEHGDYPAGTFLLNPTGFRHAPFSRDGCVLFVKLRQYGGEREHIIVDTTNGTWQPHGTGGIELLPLYEDIKGGEAIRLLKFTAGAGMPATAYPGGAEIFVLDGAMADEQDIYEKGDWVRYPPGSRPELRSEAGGTAYFKTGHMPR